MIAPTTTRLGNTTYDCHAKNNIRTAPTITSIPDHIRVPCVKKRGS